MGWQEMMLSAALEKSSQHAPSPIAHYCGIGDVSCCNKIHQLVAFSAQHKFLMIMMMLSLHLFQPHQAD